MKRGEGLERGKGNEERRKVPRLGSRMRSKMENYSNQIRKAMSFFGQVELANWLLPDYLSYSYRG